MAKYHVSFVDQYELGDRRSSGFRDDFVRINVSGMLYETMLSTLKRFPDTLLGNKYRRQKYFVPAKDAFFFDRHRTCFEAILYFYQSDGVLTRPLHVPHNVFQEEQVFFGLQTYKGAEDTGLHLDLLEDEASGASSTTG